MGSSTPLSKHSTRIKELSPFSWFSNKWILYTKYMRFFSSFFCLFVYSSLRALFFSVFFSSLFHFCFVHWNSTCFAITTQILAYVIAIHLPCRTFDKSAMNGTSPICDTHKNSFSGIYISFVANESNFNYKKVLFLFFLKEKKFFHSKIHDSRLFIRIIMYFAIGD